MQRLRRRRPGCRGSRRVYLSAQGRRFDQACAAALRLEPGLVLVAGRYEGIDERVIATSIDEELSVGDYVLSGGELPALVVIDALARLMDGALERCALECRGVVRDRSSGLAALHPARGVRGARRCRRCCRAVTMSASGAGACKQALGRTWVRRPDLFLARAPGGAGRDGIVERVFAGKADQTNEPHHPADRSRDAPRARSRSSSPATPSS